MKGTETAGKQWVVPVSQLLRRSMTSEKEYAGTITVSFMGGDTKDIKLYQYGESIWIDNHLVQDINRGSMESIIWEITIVSNKLVEKYDWIDYARPMKFKS